MSASIKDFERENDVGPVSSLVTLLVGANVRSAVKNDWVVLCATAGGTVLTAGSALTGWTVSAKTG